MQLGPARKQEVNLVIVCGVFRPCVVEEFVSRCGKHLGNYVFINVAQIGAELVVQ